MSRDDAFELDDDARALLDAFAEREQLPAAVHDRVWARVAEDVEGGRAARGLRRGMVIGALAAAAVVLLWAGVRSLPERDDSTAPHQAGYDRATAPSPERAEQPEARDGADAAAAPDDEPAPLEAPAPAVEPGPERSDTAAEPRRVAPRGSKTPAPEVSPQPPTSPTPDEATAVDDLAEENRLLRAARRALIDEQPERALARLDEHERRFPRGVLTEERQALRAVSLCEAERTIEGRAAARQFLREHPRAALAPRVRGACLE